MEWRGHETWYRVVGELPRPAPTPVVICHGGPGAAHDYVEPIAELSRDRARLRAVRPARLRQERRTCRTRPAGFWTPQLFKHELVALLARTSGSPTATPSSASPGAACSRWSTRSTGPPGLRAIVVADSPASIPLWVEEANRLRARPARRRAGDAHAPRGGRHHRRPRVRGGRRRSSTSATSAASSRSRTTSSAASTRSPPTRPSTTR